MFRDVAACMRAAWREKIAGAIALTLFFCVPYFTLQRVVLMPVHTFRPTAADDAIEFDPGWAWVYQSGYLLIAFVPWLIDRRGDVIRYFRGFALVSLIGFIMFFFLPVAGPRPASPPKEGIYGWLVSYDLPTNEFPSLHVALMTLTILAAARTSHGRLRAARRWPLLSIAILWAAAVGYAALATKQHYAIDLPAGLLLAVVVDWWLA
jgi:membrane-associated phospholipid phosphatase